MREFPCEQCGATVEFSPGSQSLRCPHCGHETAVAPAEAEVREEDFRAALADLESAQEQVEAVEVKCSSCAAEVRGLGPTTSLACPYCGTNIVATAISRRLIKPKSLLPFRITRDEALESCRRWLSGLWFAPGDVKRLAAPERRVTGMYMPAWTFDCEARSEYSGLRGDYYYVTVPRTVVVNGKPATRMSRERRVRWSPRSGAVRNEFDDVLVPASDSLPRRLAEQLEPWDLSALVPYDDAYLSGFGAESYQVELSDGFAAAARRMQPVIEASVRGDIGGDVQRILSIRTKHERITFKHVLLPVWISAFRYRGRVFRFLVNARTGEVRGERPWSAVKIGLTVLLVGAALAAAVLVALSR